MIRSTDRYVPVPDRIYVIRYIYIPYIYGEAQRIYGISAGLHCMGGHESWYHRTSGEGGQCRPRTGIRGRSVGDSQGGQDSSDAWSVHLTLSDDMGVSYALNRCVAIQLDKAQMVANRAYVTSKFHHRRAFHHRRRRCLRPQPDRRNVVRDGSIAAIFVKLLV